MNDIWSLSKRGLAENTYTYIFMLGFSSKKGQPKEGKEQKKISNSSTQKNWTRDPKKYTSSQPGASVAYVCIFLK